MHSVLDSRESKFHHINTYSWYTNNSPTLLVYKGQLVPDHKRLVSHWQYSAVFEEAR